MTVTAAPDTGTSELAGALRDVLCTSMDMPYLAREEAFEHAAAVLDRHSDDDHELVVALHWGLNFGHHSLLSTGGYEPAHEFAQAVLAAYAAETNAS